MVFEASDDFVSRELKNHIDGKEAQVTPSLLETRQDEERNAYPAHHHQRERISAGANNELL
jgi:hypothetical protein